MEYTQRREADGEILRLFGSYLAQTKNRSLFFGLYNNSRVYIIV